MLALLLHGEAEVGIGSVIAEEWGRADEGTDEVLLRIACYVIGAGVAIHLEVVGERRGSQLIVDPSCGSVAVLLLAFGIIDPEVSAERYEMLHGTDTVSQLEPCGECAH